MTPQMRNALQQDPSILDVLARTAMQGMIANPKIAGGLLDLEMADREGRLRVMAEMAYRTALVMVEKGEEVNLLLQCRPVRATGESA